MNDRDFIGCLGYKRERAGEHFYRCQEQQQSHEINNTFRKVRWNYLLKRSVILKNQSLIES